jgi:hypothetical protein
MFTWISRVAIGRAAWLCLALLLAACQIVPGALNLPGQTRSMSVLGGAMQVAAPSGYCVDKQSARQQADGAVVLIGRCSDRSQQPPAVISATIGAAGSAGVLAGGDAALAEFFRSSSGRAALSRTGKADTVQILEAANINGAFALHIAEAGVGDYWRAVLGLSGRLVTLSVQRPNGADLEPGVGRQLLGATIAAMRSANPAL